MNFPRTGTDIASDNYSKCYNLTLVEDADGDDIGSRNGDSDSESESENEEFAIQNALQLTALATALTLLSLATTVGNLLVIVSITVERNLRTVTNCFIMSLAIADVTIGVFSMPLFTSMIITGKWLFGSFVCDLWLSVDYAVSNASVTSLIIITCDRYLNVTRPLTYRAKRTKGRAAVVILFAWLVSVLLWTPGIIGWQYIDGHRAVPVDKCYVQFLLSSKLMTLVTAALAFYMPVVIMSVLYWRVYLATRRRDKTLPHLRASGKCDEAEPLSGRSSRRESRLSAQIDRVRKILSGTSPALQRRDLPTAHGEAEADGDGDGETLSVSVTVSVSVSAPTTNSSQQPIIETTEAEPEAGNELNDRPRVSDTDADLRAVLSQSRNLQTKRKTTAGTATATPSPVMRKVSLSALAHSTRSSISSAQFVAGRSETPVISACRRRRRMQVRSDAKAAKTISAVLLAFIITWTPYNVIAVVRAFCGDCIPDWIFDLGYLLCYINSTINPVCYAMCNENFRKTFKRILQCKCRTKPIPSALFALAINIARATSAAVPNASLYASSVVAQELRTRVLLGNREQ